jgi:phage replication-related protein YjqB (UPF0714/DUF867 family)
MSGFSSFHEIALQKREGEDFVRQVKDRGSSVAIIAPHGGLIEPGTSELALAVADQIFSYYLFEGQQPNNNRDLHLDSTQFDDPLCLDLLSKSQYAVSLHGCHNRDVQVYVGGRNKALQRIILHSLKSSGFPAIQDMTNHAGKEKGNICNRCISTAGVQLELSRAMREIFFTPREKGKTWEQTKVCHDFVSLLRAALRDYAIASSLGK